MEAECLDCADGGVSSDCLDTDRRPARFGSAPPQVEIPPNASNRADGPRDFALLGFLGLGLREAEEEFDMPSLSFVRFSRPGVGKLSSHGGDIVREIGAEVEVPWPNDDSRASIPCESPSSVGSLVGSARIVTSLDNINNLCQKCFSTEGL